MWAIEQIEVSAVAEDRLVLLQELPTKMVRHVIRSVTWADVDIDAATGRARRRLIAGKTWPPGRWRQLYYLMNGTRIVLLRRFWTMIARRGR
jgi:hypothetical protein